MNRAAVFSSTKFPRCELDINNEELLVVGKYQNSEIMAMCLPEEPETALVIRCIGDICQLVTSKKKVGKITRRDLENVIRCLND